ncbi:MAG: PTS sugar transporter subunit IIA [Pseudomonadota bacterium]
MIGLVIVAHGGLATELKAAMEHVVGKQEGVLAISTAPDDDLTAKQREIDEAIDAVDTGSGAAIFTDMFGGTPCNLALGAMAGRDVEVIYGANLPMLVKFAKSRDRSLTEAARCAAEAGVKYIDCASNMLSAKAS